MRTRLQAFSLALIGAVTLTACGGGDESAPAGWQPDASGKVTLQFAAYNGNTPIDCGSSLKLGTTGRAVKMSDLRFYISNVNLIRADGGKQRLSLASRADNYNYDDGANAVSLVDLEVKDVGLCKATAAVNATITGTVPAGQYVGAEMTLGVPLALNHSDATAAATPAVLQSGVHPGMAWNWRGGRKFTNIMFSQDMAVDSTQWPATAPTAPDTTFKPGWVLMHLGSTGCITQDQVANPALPTASAPVSASSPIVRCKAPNRVPVMLDNFNPAKQVIAFDAGALFNEDIATEGDRGCMSSSTDAACAKPFAALALNFNAADGSGSGQPVAGQTQSVFKVMDR